MVSSDRCVNIVAYRPSCVERVYCSIGLLNKDGRDFGAAKPDYFGCSCKLFSGPEFHVLFADGVGNAGACVVAGETNSDYLTNSDSLRGAFEDLSGSFGSL